MDSSMAASSSSSPSTVASSSSSPSTVKKLTLKSSDGIEFIVDEEVASMSGTINLMIEDDCANDTIPLRNITSSVLVKVLDYCRAHVEFDKQDEKGKYVEKDRKAWDAEFLKIELDDIVDLILAANYLNIEGLMDSTTKAVADMIRGKSIKKIRKILRIKNDYTKEEEDELRRQNAWAFEDDD